MRRQLVYEQADTGLVAAVYEAGEACRRAEPPRRREQADRLVAPGTGEWVLADRQALDVREAEVTDIWNELVRDLVPIDRAAVGAPAPGDEVDLVDRDRGAGGLTVAAPGHPAGVAPAPPRPAVPPPAL